MSLKKAAASQKRAISLPKPDNRANRAAMLDRLADHQLHLGYHLAAERISRAAAELREAGR